MEEVEHRCYGCAYDDGDSYLPECAGCRMKGNMDYNTEDEELKFKSLPIKYIPKEISYGAHRLLKRSSHGIME